jgi:uncharacterized protein
MHEEKLNDQEIAVVLSEEPVGHLALSKKDQPYIVPLNYVYKEGQILFHCRKTGRKVDYIASNKLTCFQVGSYGKVLHSESPCKFNYSYKSVLVEGNISEVKDLAAKEEALEAIIEKYAGLEFGRGRMLPENIDSVKVFAIKPSVISGKRDS